MRRSTFLFSVILGVLLIVSIPVSAEGGGPQSGVPKGPTTPSCSGPLHEPGGGSADQPGGPAIAAKEQDCVQSQGSEDCAPQVQLSVQARERVSATIHAGEALRNGDPDSALYRIGQHGDVGMPGLMTRALNRWQALRQMWAQLGERLQEWLGRLGVTPGAVRP